MSNSPTATKSIDTYIAGFPKDVQQILQQIREMIQNTAPAAEETISYNMPTFTLNGRPLIYFAAYKKHISLYPAPIGVPEFVADIAVYQSGQGTLKFPLDQPIPFDLINRVVKYRMQQVGN